MTKRADDQLLSDILHEAEVAVRICSGLTLEQFEQDELRIRAAERCLEIIGEASGKVSQEAKDKMPGIPWSRMAGMRNRLAHAYWGTDVEIILNAAQENLPGVIRQLLAAGVISIPARQKLTIKKPD